MSVYNIILWLRPCKDDKISERGFLGGSEEFNCVKLVSVKGRDGEKIKKWIKQETSQFFTVSDKSERIFFKKFFQFIY